MDGAEKILLPTAYFPPVSYILHFSCYNQVLIEQMETYPKQTYRNRCEIMTSSGKLSLVVPVSKPNGNHTMTRDIEICYREPWQQHHWKSIATAYSSSPYFDYYSDILQPLFNIKERSLIALNQSTLKTLLNILGIKHEANFTTDYFRNPQGMLDLRDKMKPGRLIEMNFKEYPQVFSHKFGFKGNLSVLDLLFNLGPDSRGYF